MTAHYNGLMDLGSLVKRCWS